jgi:ankyrin repeat protein
LLLESGADSNTKDGGGFAALHLAAWHGHTVIVQLLVEMGADLLLQDWWGDTALDLAARRRHENIIGILLEAARTRADSIAFRGLENKSDAVAKFLMGPDIFDMFWKDSGSLQGMTDEEAKRWFSERSIQSELADERLEHKRRD